MAGLGNKLNPNSMVLTDRGYISAAEAEYQHSLGNLNIIGRDGRAVNSQDLVRDGLDPNDPAAFEPTAQDIIKDNLDSLIGMPALEAAALYKEYGGFGGSNFDPTFNRATGSSGGIQSAQEMFNETYEEARAADYLASILESQGVPDVVPFSVEDALRSVNVSNGVDAFEANYVKDLLDQGLLTVSDISKQTGISEQDIQNTYNQMSNLSDVNLTDDLVTTENLQTTNLENDLLNNEVDMIDSSVTGLGGDESIVTDDPEAKWKKVDKTKDLASIFQDALDIFGAYNRDSIRKVVDIVNERGVSAAEVADMTGNSVESINQAAAESDTAIINQETGEGTGDGGTATNGDATNGDATNGDETNGDEVTTKTTTTTNNETSTTSTTNDSWENDGAGASDETVSDRVIGDGVTATDVLNDRVVDEDPEVVIDERPILPTIVQPQEATNETNFSLFQTIQNTPITDSLLFEPEFTKLDNIPVGMFERFLQATGGR